MGEIPAAVRLTRDAVLRAALELLNEAGIDNLSTRRLAQRLGVQSPTLYWHFKSKADLLDAMAETIMLERHGQSLPQPGEAWQDWFVANACSFRNALLAYRDGARLHAGTRPQHAHFDAIEAKLRLLCEAGFTPAQALNLMLALGRFVIGWVLEEQAAQQADAPPSAQSAGPDTMAHPLFAAGWQEMEGESKDGAFVRSVNLFVRGAQAELRGLSQ
jgi:TetR/AcrR family tetracycline transcriptional repressor